MRGTASPQEITMDICSLFVESDQVGGVFTVAQTSPGWKSPSNTSVSLCPFFLKFVGPANCKRMAHTPMMYILCSHKHL